MINKNTTIIIGAGASSPYGYPTGKKLRENIISGRKARVERYIRSVFNPVMGDGLIDKYDDFVNAFSKSSTKSIDLFISRNPDFQLIGKTLIWYYILTSEKRSKFREDVKEDDWYSYLFTRMTDKLMRPSDIHITKNNIKFITFNYDRSFEHFLYESLRYSFTVASEEDILKVINNIKIVHIFGKVFDLDWQDGIPKVKYNRNDLLTTDIEQYVHNIQTINEDSTIESQKKIISDIKKSETVIFLGFGFLEENMKILGFPDVIGKVREVYGTGIGYTNREREQIVMKYFSKVNNYSQNVHIENLNCTDLLREFL